MQHVTPKRVGKILEGVVVLDKMQKTVVVKVERVKKVAKYGKYIRVRKKYLAHDAHGEFHVGDQVRIQESRPLSRRKRWVVIGKI